MSLIQKYGFITNTIGRDGMTSSQIQTRFKGEFFDTPEDALRGANEKIKMWNSWADVQPAPEFFGAIAVVTEDVCSFIPSPLTIVPVFIHEKD
jgi:hypothetical protein